MVVEEMMDVEVVEREQQDEAGEHRTNDPAEEQPQEEEVIELVSTFSVDEYMASIKGGTAV